MSICEHSILVGTPCHECMDKAANIHQETKQIIVELESVRLAIDSWAKGSSDSITNIELLKNLELVCNNLRKIIIGG